MRIANTDRNMKHIAIIIMIVLAFIFTMPITLAEYEVFPDTIHEKVKTYELVEEIISIKNKNAVPITGMVALEGNITEFITIDNTSAVIQPGTEGQISLRFFGKGAEEGRYEGAVVISGDVQQRIPLVFDTQEGDGISTASIIVDVNLLQPIVVRGGTLKFKTDALNLLSETTQDLELIFNAYKLEGNDISNKSIYSDAENASVQQSYSKVKSVEIPPDAEVGDYILRVTTGYLNHTSTTDTLFTVKERFYEQDLFGVVPVWFLSLFMTLFTTGYMSYRVYKKRADSKKRFHATIEYDLLPQEGPRSLFIGNIAETKSVLT
jgi:hypothetical protein